MRVVAAPSVNDGCSAESGAPGVRATIMVRSIQTWNTNCSRAPMKVSGNCRPGPALWSNLLLAGMVISICVAMASSFSSHVLFRLSESSVSTSAMTATQHKAMTLTITMNNCAVMDCGLIRSAAPPRNLGRARF